MMAGTKRGRTDAIKSLPPAVLKRLIKEYKDILSGKHETEYFNVEPQSPDDLARWKGWIKGVGYTKYVGTSPT